MNLIVFDLDLTLWDCGRSLWRDCTTPPYHLQKNLTIRDHQNTKIRLYPDVCEILEAIKISGTEMALASRTSAPDQARELLHLFSIDHYFEYQQIYPGDKQAHFQALRKDSKIAFEDMTFFDDELRNIESVGELGVNVAHTPHGLHWEDLWRMEFSPPILLSPPT